MTWAVSVWLAVWGFRFRASDFGFLGFWVQIMGLNPPFGVNGSKASQFVLRATEFRPRLIILIVPPETKQ